MFMKITFSVGCDGKLYHRCGDLGVLVDGDDAEGDDVEGDDVDGDDVEGHLQHGHHLANHSETSSAQVLASCYLLFIVLISW